MIQLVQAHNHFTPRQIMHETTIGQVFVLFDGLSRYVKLTSPWGSGDEKKPARKSVDTMTAAFEAQKTGSFAVAPPTHVSNLDPALQAILLDDSED